MTRDFCYEMKTLLIFLAISVLALLWWIVGDVLVTEPAQKPISVLAPVQVDSPVRISNEFLSAVGQVPDIAPPVGATLDKKPVASDSVLSWADVDRWIASMAGGQLKAEGERLKAENPGESPGVILELLVSVWAEGRPAEAAAWVAALPDPVLQAVLLPRVGIAWLKRSVPDAVAWGCGMTNEVLRDGVLTAMGFEVARTDPVEALNLLVSMMSPPVEGRFLTYVAAQWAARDPRAASEWMARIDDEAQRAECLAAVASAWADRSPEDALCFAVLSMPPSLARERAVVGIIQRWAQQKPKEAAGWVLAMPEGELQLVSMENLIINWGWRDRQAADVWLNSLPESPLREHGLATLARCPDSGL